MIIDIHTHIFPESVRRRREAYFDNEPAFAQLYSSSASRIVGADELVAAMDDNAVDRAVTFGFPWRTMETNRKHNDYILEAVSRHPKRLTGFCCVDIRDAGAPAEVGRCLTAGLSGVGELALYDADFSEPCLAALDPIMALCRRFDCPLMCHTNEPVGHIYPGKAPNTLAGIYALVKRFPDNRIILAHWGGGLFFYSLLKKEVTQALANVWFDTAASPYLYRPEIYKTAITMLGADKFVFGSDYPLLPPKRYFKEMDQAGLTADEKTLVCGANAAAVLKLPIEASSCHAKT
jgi:predicted TIM-barrel fold metal-dependent hydrolase